MEQRSVAPFRRRCARRTGARRVRARTVHTLAPRPGRDTRGLGGTYAALGGWALASGAPTAQVAVGATWIGAAGARLASLVLDRPDTDATFWAYLIAEIGFGCLAIGSARAQSHLQPTAAAR